MTSLFLKYDGVKMTPSSPKHKFIHKYLSLRFDHFAHGILLGTFSMLLRTLHRNALYQKNSDAICSGLNPQITPVYWTKAQIKGGLGEVLIKW